MEINIEKAQDAPSRLSMILWGESGSGKTTLAATMPGKKLWILFDPDGDQSIRHIPNWDRVNMTTELGADIMRKYILATTPLDFDRILEGYDTVIIDSLTKLSEHALKYAVTQARSSSKFQPTFEQPGIEGYGLRNTHMSMFISNTLRVTSRLNKHVCFITHERDGDKDSEGRVLSVAMMLGGQLPNITSKDISEVWHVRDQAGKRQIALRPERLRSPMKTRMFDTSTNATSFEWKYNATKDEGHKISTWWETYIKSGYQKLPIPK